MAVLATTGLMDTAVVVAAKAGLTRPYTVVLADGDAGVFSVIAYAFAEPSREQTLHIDRYGGQVVSAYGYAQYTALARPLPTASPCTRAATSAG